MSDPEELIATWRQRLAAITANANELSDAESTKRIRIRAREGHYSGVTRQRAEQAIAQLSTLTDDYLLLARVVDSAMQEQQGSMFASRESKTEKVLELLEGPSIVRPAGRVPLKNRSLLGSALEKNEMTPSQLLTCMQLEFGQARDTFEQIDRAEQLGQSELAELRNDYAQMEQRALRLGAAADRPSFIELQNQQSDPLSASAGLESLKRSLSAWAATLDSLEQARTQSESALARAKEVLEELRRLAQACESQLAQVGALLGPEAAAAVKPASLSQIGMLQSWWETLESSLAAGQWSAVNVGASRINAALDETVAGLRGGIAQARGRCVEFDELEGRFSALKAKERALRERGDSALDCRALREQIEAALRARPVALTDARELLRRYQDLLAQGH